MCFKLAVMFLLIYWVLIMIIIELNKIFLFTLLWFQGKHMNEILLKFFVDYLKNILNNFEFSNRIAQERMLESIPKLVSIEDNK